jgi:hypothetical protein
MQWKFVADTLTDTSKGKTVYYESQALQYQVSERELSREVYMNNSIVISWSTVEPR